MMKLIQHVRNPYSALKKFWTSGLDVTLDDVTLELTLEVMLYVTSGKDPTPPRVFIKDQYGYVCPSSSAGHDNEVC